MGRRICASCWTPEDGAATPAKPGLPGIPKRAQPPGLQTRCRKCGAANWRDDDVSDKQIAEQVKTDTALDAERERRVDPFDRDWI